MVRLVKIQDELSGIISAQSNSSPVVVFSSAASLFVARSSNFENELASILEFFSDLSRERDVLMPAFPVASNDEVINLDFLKSKNGLISEMFRLRNPSSRTKSSIFPFTATGPNAKTLFSLEPSHVWGDDSLYGWLESMRATVVTIGLRPYVCSIQHRAEFINLDRIDYRGKSFRNANIILRGESLKLKEGLSPRIGEAVVDFAPIEKRLSEIGQLVTIVDGVTISSVRADKKIALASTMIVDDPNVFKKGG